MRVCEVASSNHSLFLHPLIHLSQPVQKLNPTLYPVPAVNMTTNTWSHTYPSENCHRNKGAKYPFVCHFCDCEINGLGYSGSGGLLWHPATQKRLCGRECFLSMSSEIHPGPVTQQGDCAGGCWGRTECWLAIVDCADTRIMFARLLGQNIMSHAVGSEEDGCADGIWWIEMDI